MSRWFSKLLRTVPEQTLGFFADVPKGRQRQADTVLMKHVSAIKDIVAKGQFEEAHQALEDLLELGPNNMEALKLKAALFQHVGRFDEEENVWRRIIEVDHEDEEAIAYFQRSQLEDREHYYFTDPLPGGGRRFLAYPRALVSVSFVGLLGCVSFLLLTRTSGENLTRSPLVLFAAFALLVLSPWIAIIYLYLRTLRSINVTSPGFEVTTRFKNFLYPWTAIKQIYLAHSDNPETSDLRLIIVPQDNTQPPMSIDFGEDTSAVRARRHLLQEIRDYHHDIRYGTLTTAPVDRKGVLKF